MGGNKEKAQIAQLLVMRRHRKTQRLPISTTPKCTFKLRRRYRATPTLPGTTLLPFCTPTISPPYKPLLRARRDVQDFATGGADIIMFGTQTV
jgi:hypothetical protein